MKNRFVLAGILFAISAAFYTFFNFIYPLGWLYYIDQYIYTIITPFKTLDLYLAIPLQLAYSYLLANFYLKAKRNKALTLFILYFLGLDVAGLISSGLSIASALFAILITSAVFLLIRLRKRSDMTQGWLNIYLGGRVTLNLIAIILNFSFGLVLGPILFLILHAGVWIYSSTHLKR